MRIAVLSVILTAGVCTAAWAQHAPPAGPYHGHQLVRVEVGSPEMRDRVLDLATTAWNCRVGTGLIDVQVTPEQLGAIRALGLEPQVVIPDVQALLDQEQREIAEARLQRDASWFGVFRTLTEVHARLDLWATQYPTLAETFVAGQTLQGRNIKGIRITAPDQPGNPRISRPAVLFNSCQHAREWATPMTTMWIGDRLLESYGTDARLSALVNQCEIIIIPVVNCDGYEFSWQPNNRLWRKNRRDNGDGTFGVDPNRNWGYQWGGEGASTNPGNDTYRGTGPFSEPETQVMRDFITANTRLRAHIDFHSFSQLILAPWGYTSELPPDRPIFAFLEEDMREGIFGVHGRVYDAGPAYTTIYPASGVAPDWSFGARGLLAYTIEVRDQGTYGFVMPVSEIIPNAEENFEAAIRLAESTLLPLYVVPVGEYPSVLTTSAPELVRLAVRAAKENPATPLLWTRVNGGAWTSQPMGSEVGSTFTGALPALGCGNVVEYYFEAPTTTGTSVTYPAGGATLLARGVDLDVTFADDMETDRGWTVGAPGDTATLGIWNRCDPEATAAQPGNDATFDPGVLAWITDCRAGTGVGSFDVDGGTTTLTSPRFGAVPASGRRVAGVRLSYARWHSNNAGANPNQDTSPILLSNDDGATWVQLEGAQDNAGVWQRKAWRLEEFLPPTDRMRLRFVASDLGAGSIVECGLDDVRVEVLSCPIDLDYNADGNADQDDIACLAQTVAGEGSCTVLDPDFNGDGNVDQDDVQALAIAIGGG
ncbi:MAG: M14 family zinc carboxypeptidase [Planctomycetota bacterium]|nr:M14 family zinc carboxypeptidase [Planctomycetota bacterium]